MMGSVRRASLALSLLLPVLAGGVALGAQVFATPGCEEGPRVAPWFGYFPHPGGGIQRIPLSERPGWYRVGVADADRRLPFSVRMPAVPLANRGTLRAVWVAPAGPTADLYFRSGIVVEEIREHWSRKARRSFIAGFVGQFSEYACRVSIDGHLGVAAAPKHNAYEPNPGVVQFWDGPLVLWVYSWTRPVTELLPVAESLVAR